MINYAVYKSSVSQKLFISGRMVKKFQYSLDRWPPSSLMTSHLPVLQFILSARDH